MIFFKGKKPHLFFFPPMFYYYYHHPSDFPLSPLLLLL